VTTDKVQSFQTQRIRSMTILITKYMYYVPDAAKQVTSVVSSYTRFINTATQSG